MNKNTVFDALIVDHVFRDYYTGKFEIWCNNKRGFMVSRSLLLCCDLKRYGHIKNVKTWLFTNLLILIERTLFLCDSFKIANSTFECAVDMHSSNDQSPLVMSWECNLSLFSNRNFLWNYVTKSVSLFCLAKVEISVHFIDCFV